jgi:hypothetical protein
MLKISPLRAPERTPGVEQPLLQLLLAVFSVPALQQPRQAT